MSDETETTARPTKSEIRARHEPGQDVAAELVETEGVGAARRLEALRQRLRRRIVGREGRAERGRQHRKEHDREPDPHHFQPGGFAPPVPPAGALAGTPECPAPRT